MPKRTWNFGRIDLGETKSWEAVHAARSHTTAHWKRVRATIAHITHPRNTLKMKRRRAGAFTLLWTTYWRGGWEEESWWKHSTSDGLDERNSFFKTASDLVNMSLTQRLKLEKWTPSIGFQTRVHISLETRCWSSTRMRGIWKAVDPSYKECDSPCPQRAGRGWGCSTCSTVTKESGTRWRAN